jgi:hypothetical protein
MSTEKPQRLQIDYTLTCTECRQPFEFVEERCPGKPVRLLVDVRSHPECMAQVLRRGGQA